MPTPEPLRIPTPDHGPVTITLSGNQYTYTEPRTRLEHDQLYGMFLYAAVKMNQSTDCCISSAMARRMGESDDPKKEAQVIQQEVLQDNSAILGAGGFLAIVEIFNAVCAGLRLTPGARSFLEDNYDANELFAAYGIMFGLIQRPFGGTRKGTKPASQTPTG